MMVVKEIVLIKAILLFAGLIVSSLILTIKSYPLYKNKERTVERIKEFHGKLGALNIFSVEMLFLLKKIKVPSVTSITTEIVLATILEVSIPL